VSSEFVVAETRCRRERFKEESRRVSGDGASSSSLSLQPRPVVSPTPSRNVSPSRCRSFRTRLSRSSLPSPRSSLECGESKPCLSIRLGRGVWRSMPASSPLSSNIEAMSGLADVHCALPDLGSAGRGWGGVAGMAASMEEGFGTGPGDWDRGECGSAVPERRTRLPRPTWGPLLEFIFSRSHKTAR